MIESLFEKQQKPVPGPLDATFHVLLLAAGDPGYLDPQRVLDISNELDLSGRGSLAKGFYTDIQPRLVGSSEEIFHTIEVAVRRSFDFMKCPLIFGGDSTILPAIIRGVEGQSSFEILKLEDIGSVGTKSVVVEIDGDSVSSFQIPTALNLFIDQVKAIVVTGTTAADIPAVLKAVLDLCDRIKV